MKKYDSNKIVFNLKGNIILERGEPMKLNLDFYKGKDLKSDDGIEDEIIKYIEKYEEFDYENIFKNDMRWPVFYHLTPIRQNILNWYEFKQDSNVLEVGAEMGAITGMLCDKVKNVTAVELSKKRAEAIQKRHKTRENLEVIVGNLNEIKFDKKFDYITLIDVLEYATLFTNGSNPFVNFLTHIKSLLKEDGKLLIAIENKFGMKYFAGAVEDHDGIVYESITGCRNSKKMRIFGKVEMEKLLNNIGLINQKFYYPLPDYKLPNTIFSDNYLPNIHNISTYLPYYYEKCNINFSEIEAYKEVIKNNNFHFFSNSFFIECSTNKLEDSVNFISFSNYRKAKYRMMTCINDKVVKKNIDSKSEEHFKQYIKNLIELKEKQFNCIERYTDNLIESDYIQNFKSLKEVLYEKYSENQKDEFYNIINQYRELLLKDKADIEKNSTIFNKYDVAVDESILNEFDFVKSGFWDLIFQNCFINEGEFHCFDQEWKDEFVPVQFILYRCIIGYMGVINPVDIEEMFLNLGITKYIDLFVKLEEKIQKTVRDETMYNFYTRKYMSINEQKEVQIQNILKEQEKHLEIMKNIINEKEVEIKEKDNIIRQIKGSRTWKYIEWIRRKKI